MEDHRILRGRPWPVKGAVIGGVAGVSVTALFLGACLFLSMFKPDHHGVLDAAAYLVVIATIYITLPTEALASALGWEWARDFLYYPSACAAGLNFLINGLILAAFGVAIGFAAQFVNRKRKDYSKRAPNP